MFRSWSPAKRITVATFIIVALIYAWFILERRWMSDDGMIYLRSVRQILEGNGPVFNVYERAESNTSALWIWILAALGTVTGHLSLLAVCAGGVLSLAGFVIAMDATRRLIRMRGGTAPIVPGAALVVVGSFQFWDYATSGLETGLAFAWLATCWWLLVTLTPKRMLVSAIIVGLGPLVRPDLGIATIVLFVVMWRLERLPWKRALALLGAGLALPLAYEIFRAGYYGTLVPLPALAKSATSAAWTRGFAYLRDYLRPSLLLVPAGIFIVLLAVKLRTLATRERIIVATPIAIGLLLAVYVIRVGGDFMHARLLLLPTYSLLLPGFVLPLGRLTTPVVGALVIWAIWAVITVGDGKSHVSTGLHIGDERLGYVRLVARAHPIKPESFTRVDRASTAAAQAIRDHRRRMIWQDGPDVPMKPGLPGPIVYVAGRLGTAGFVAPLDAMVADTLGLANPLGARITPTNRGFTGHEKVIPWAWLIADFADPANDEDPQTKTPAYQIRAARHALQCGELAELMQSVREPMTASRFWANLTGSLRRTRLVIPSDPVEAEQTFCGYGAMPAVSVSNEYPYDGWSRYAAVDGKRASEPNALGHTNRGKPTEGPEWIELHYGTPRSVSKVVLYQANEGEGFPIAFEIQIWDGKRWVTRVTQSDFTPPGKGVAMPFSWTPADTTTRVRIVGTKLRTILNVYQFQIGEIEIF